MSGGERKKRASEGTGWEEAGGEFYQECYPGTELDLEALPRDPHYFATLLPSKQNRAATTRRPRQNTKATFKRRTSTRNRNYNTMGQNTMPNDIHVAMMPDLSENLANEETTWEEIMLIKTMPINMTQKKEIKAKLQSADTFRLQGLKQFKWKRRKFWEYLKIRRKEFLNKIELWRKSFIEIEGNFGTGVSAFFVFIKWLMYLNLCLSILNVCFIVLPTLLLSQGESPPCVSHNGSVLEDCCLPSIPSSDWSNATFDPLPLLIGDGWLETTIMYYGVYPNSALHDFLINYNLPTGYIATFFICLAVSFSALIKRAAHGFKERLIENDGQYYKYCTLIFSGWEYGLCNESSAKIKQLAIFREIKNSLEAERQEDDKMNLTREEKFRLFSVRMFVHSIVLIILFAIGSLIFFIFQYSIKELKNNIENEWEKLLLEYAPYLFVVGVHLVVPGILNYLVTLEGYSSAFALHITFVRTVILRLSSFCVLLASFYYLVSCPNGTETSCTVSSCQRPFCWENYIGRQTLKLLVVDVVVNAFITFFINFPRMLIAKHIKCKLARMIGRQDFKLPKHILDVVFMQTLIWFGSFYVPLLPVLGTFLFFLTFYIKKFSCVVNSSPSVIIYRASKSDSVFMAVLLVSYITVIVPWGYTLSALEPSQSCGPFKGRRSLLSLILELYQGLPKWLVYTLENITSSVFVIPAFFVLVFALYYFYVISQANKQMIGVLKKQLILEGHDKQFLLNRLSAFIKQHQDRHKAARSVDPPPGTSN